MQRFLDALHDRTLLFDGAMGTEIQKLELTSDSFPGGQAGFNDGLTVTCPDNIATIHHKYLDAGADCIETNTFGSNLLKLEEYNMADQTFDINRQAAEIAVRAASSYEERYVIGTMGPTGFLPSSTEETLGNTPLEDIEEAFHVQAKGLAAGGVDAILIETGNDMVEMKMAILAAKPTGLPIMANVTFPQYGKMLLGTPVDAAYITLSGMGIDAFGVNCSTGPVEMTPAIDWLNHNASHPILMVPNAGLPENVDGCACYSMTPDIMTGLMADILAKYHNVKIIGGCCGTTPEHIRRLRQMMDDLQAPIP
ncbi:MAG: methionine synthase [Cenarchaeum sp. SB0666_bin_15]|nr:methionine synthase [Cenarchaeum sp. SB0666_bin_15]MYG32453.1 methionine synthase [Cenarchaeum sp. SB0677_bin_16]